MDDAPVKAAAVGESVVERRERTWDAFARTSLSPGAGIGPGGAHRGPGWFASLSYQPNTELNICGLDPDATRAGAHELLAVLGPDLPCLVFSSEVLREDVRDVLRSDGFTSVDVPEPLMSTTSPPSAVPGDFRVAPASDEQGLAAAIALSAEAHHVDRDQLAATLLPAARSGAAQMWLAHDGDEPVSAVWMVRDGRDLAVTSMMTPSRHQRRGAGRALLSTALAVSWPDGTDRAVLLSTPAGRRLYESLGFVAVDEVVTCHRGLDDEVMEAIGQPP